MEWLDPLALARWQFGLTTVYHYLFVPLTIGMALVAAIFRPRGCAPARSSTCT